MTLFNETAAMRSAKKTVRFIFNKYLIAVVAFAAMMLFFDDNNVFVQWDRRQQLNNLLRNKAYYEEQIKTTQHQLNQLQSNPAAIEKFVRENYLMKRDNEDVFIVESPVEKGSDKK